MMARILALPGSRPPPRSIALCSGKGGVGKSQIAASLGVVLAQDGMRPLLLDADVGCGNLDVLLGASPRRDLRDVLAGACTPEEAVCTAQLDGCSLDLLPAPMPDRRGAELTAKEQQALLDAAARVGRAYDVLLLDCGAGVSRNPMMFAAAADTVLLVATPEPTSLKDAYAAAKVLHEGFSVTRFELVVNQAQGSEDGRRVHAQLRSVVSRFLRGVELDLLAALPADERVGKAVRARRPAALAAPTSAFSHGLRMMARRLLDLTPAVPAPGQLRFFGTPTDGSREQIGSVAGTSA
jgi:flagellar biosynthesis protein FlhG